MDIGLLKLSLYKRISLVADIGAGADIDSNIY